MPDNVIQVIVRCYAELNDQLPPQRQFHDFPLVLHSPATIESLLTSLALPLENIDLILLNGTAVSPDTPLTDKDRVSLFPPFESFDISALQQIRNAPLRKPSFILDVHLGKLARFLRLLGFDTKYERSGSINSIILQANNEHRTILSMSHAYYQHPQVLRFYRIESNVPRTQLLSVLRRFDLRNLIRPFTRCIECNTLLCSYTRENIPADRIPQKVFAVYQNYEYCPHCDRYYWKGSHYERMKVFVDEIIGQTS